MKLTANFTLAEFTRSETAEARGIRNAPVAEHLGALRRTAEGLEAVRALLDARITITSGYRSPALNRAVGGVPNSDHALGWAADITVAGMSPRTVAAAIVDSDIRFDQVILETSRGVVHVSFNPRMRRQVLTQAGGPGTPFTIGLPPVPPAAGSSQRAAAGRRT